MIGIIDYGMGNIFSLTGALDRLEVKYILSDDPKILEECEALILPGVGAFRDAIRNLKEKSLDSFIKDWAAQDKALLGICLGMQLLFTKSYELGDFNGLDLIPGEVKKIPSMVKIPHMGWNNIECNKTCAYFADIKPEDAYLYFVHSYYVDTPEEYLVAYADYGIKIPAIVEKASLIGMQFHPEKSGDVGNKILKNLLKSWRVI